MKFTTHILLLICLGVITTSCFNDNDDVIRPSSSLDIKSFIHRGMNFWYLYKEDVPDLANDRFSSNEELESFLNGFDAPEELFEHFVATQDEFSWMVSDYIELERSFDGISLNNGMEYGLARYPDSDNLVYGFVRYVIPNSDADEKGIKRGDIFSTVNGTQINDTNFRDLLAPDSYTIGLATFDGTTVTPTNTSIELVKSELSEHPIHLAKVLTVNDINIGYLMYNSFNDVYDTDLNNTFGDFAAQGVTELVLDLRYNGGGNTETAKDLCSMITGQFNDEVFSTEVWNTELQENFENNNSDRLVNKFDNRIRSGASINSLELNKIYVLTTGSSASASELVINSLDPYIEVIQIGSTTRGKFQASITVYDSPNFRRDGSNLGHRYAMQPLVLKTANSIGTTDYVNGFTPEIELNEDRSDLGIIGDENEPLLQAAIQNITGGKIAPKTTNFDQTPLVGESGAFRKNYQLMYKR